MLLDSWSTIAGFSLKHRTATSRIARMVCEAEYVYQAKQVFLQNGLVSTVDSQALLGAVVHRSVITSVSFCTSLRAQ